MADDLLSLEDFEPHVGTAFRCSLGQGLSVELALSSAERLPSRAEGLRPPFSLLFRGRFAAAPVQGTYRLEHPAMGTLDLFLVPVGLTGDRFDLEAVFA